jgi:hypothetical protein
MKKSLLLLPFVVAFTIVGCSQPVASGEKQKDEVAISEKEAPKAENNTVNDVPKELMHAGAEYFGLSNAKVIDLKVEQKGKDDLTGGQQIRLTESKDGTATFEVLRTGGLAQLGGATVELRKDGVYTLQNENMKLESPMMELPAELSMGGETYQMTNIGKVVGTKKVKTDLGEYDALVIENKIAGTQGATPFTVNTVGYYVKGRGAVRVELTRISKGATTTMVITETK